jgi:NADH:ubiquinone oxidoreductase subunit 3 (subunit A)
MSIQLQNIGQENELSVNYKMLSDERNQIEKITREYETINRAVENGNIIVTSNYYSYISLFLIAILLILLFFKFSFVGSQSGGGNNIDYLHNVYKFLPLFLALFAIFYFIKIHLVNEYY